MALRAASVYKVAARLPASRASKQQGRLFSTPSSGTGPSMRNPSGTSRRTEVAKRQASAFAAQLQGERHLGLAQCRCRRRHLLPQLERNPIS